MIPSTDKRLKFSLSKINPTITLVKGSKVLNNEDFWGPISLVPTWNSNVAIPEVANANNTLKINAEEFKLNVKVFVIIEIINTSILPINER